MNRYGIRTCGTLVALVCLTLGSAAADEVADVTSGDATRREAAIQRLRVQGPAGVDALIARWHEIQKQANEAPERTDLGEALESLDRAIDAVGGARHTRQSGLYWYTDLQQAMSAARAQGKPILALRLLGNLTDDFSCANSRFFRAMLYPNQEVSRYLRENYVLTWKPVCPAPRITIDFGDGRKLERTITGNSIHYVLDADGAVIDAIPGLYGPKAFLEQLKRARVLTSSVAALPRSERTTILQASHREALEQVVARWEADLRTLRIAPTSASAPAVASVANVSTTPVTNAEMQERMRNAALASSAYPPPGTPLDQKIAELEQRTTEQVWQQLATLHATEARIDEASRGVVASHKPTAVQAGRLALTKRIVEDPLLRVVRNFEHAIAIDTVKNEYQMHRRLHGWLATSAPFASNVDLLNDVVYTNLFLMPLNDPWLGLAPPDVYSALPNSGVVLPPPPAPPAVQANRPSQTAAVPAPVAVPVAAPVAAQAVPQVRLP